MDNFEMNNVSPYCCKYSYSSSSSSSSSSPSSSSSKSQQLVSSAAPPKKKAAGRKKFRETRHPVYRGVRQRNGDRWVCEVREPNKKTRIWLGTYPTPEMAARAHDAAVLALRGSSAIFNFPHSVSLLPIASSSSPADIRAAAAKAAETDYSSSSLFTTSTISSVRNSNGDGDNDDEYSRSMFFDEEALYNMPVLLDSMAEGLLMTPPSIKHAFDWDNNLQYDDHQSLTYLNLWTH